MNIRRNFVGVVLIVTQITLLRAQNAPKIDAILEDITGENFYGAVKKIEERDDLQSTMNSVIFILNNDINNEGVFNLLLEFLNYNSDDLEICLATYLAMHKNIYFMDRVKTLRLIKSFNSHFHFQPHLLPQKGLKQFKHKLYNSVSSIVKEDLKEAMRTNNNDALSTICEDIYKYYPELLKQVFKPALSQVFNDVNVENLIKFFLKHKHAAQNIYAFSGIFDELKKGNLNQALVVDLAFGLKEAADAIKLASDDEAMELMKVKNDLPKSVRNLAFSESVCIKNTDKNEYLYAASDGFNYDNERRNVFTWVSGAKVTQGIWFIVRNDDAYLIKSQNHTDEYLYASYNTASAYTFYRKVFTWIPKGTGNYLEFNWKFEPFGDDVYIRSDHEHEYLAARIDKKDDDRRYVGTRYDKTKHKYSTWTVVDCTWSYSVHY